MAARAPQFTPGPWSVRDMPWATGTKHIIDPGRGGVATTLSRQSVNPADKAQVLANARLIAAAPELYQRLTEAREAIASLDDGALGWGEEPHGMLGKNIYPIKDELLHYIDAALAKARGDQ